MHSTSPELLVIARHGQSELNLLKGRGWAMPEESSAQSEEEVQVIRRLKKTPNHKVQLTPFGVQQARATGIGLRDRFGTFDAVIHTGHVRSTDTLKHILTAYTDQELLEMQILEDQRFRERESGPTQYMTKEEVDRAFPWQQNYYQVEGPYNFRPPSGESLADLCNGRVLFGFYDLCHRFAGKRVLIVGHGRSTFFCLPACIENLTVAESESWLQQKEVDNCSVMAYVPNIGKNALVLQECDLIFWK